MTPPNLSGEQLRVAVVEALDLPPLSNPVSYPADAHRVMEWLRGNGWYSVSHFRDQSGSYYICTASETGSFVGSTWMEAVCRAALSVKRVAREKEKS